MFTRSFFLCACFLYLFFVSVHLKNLDIFNPIFTCDKRGENVRIFRCAETKLLIWLKVKIVFSYVLKSYTTAQEYKKAN